MQTETHLTMGLMKVIFLVATVTITCNGQNNGEWRDEYREMIVDLHNEKRSAEKGCNMKEMKYDQELENQAKEWALKCTLKHESVRGRGENLGWSSYNKEDWALISQLFNMWYNERKTFGRKSKNCGLACHYTQVVWANTDKVGCYFTKCPTHRYLVCFYRPGGNYPGQRPYTKECNSTCLEGQVEKNWLCADIEELIQTD